MNRRHVFFSCDGDRLAGTIDVAAAQTGLLIVTGGNEVRSGPWGGQARLAGRIAEAGFPVMRFDRRGVGDSEGANRTFADSSADIAAAIQAFRKEMPKLQRIVAFGNCDAASALMLARGKGCDALVLANPWTFDPADADSAVSLAKPGKAEMPPSALRLYYLRRLFNPAALKRLLSGKVRVAAMASSLADAAKPDQPPGPLATAMASGLEDYSGAVTILLAENDRTAQSFRAVWNRNDPRIRICPGAGHSFVEPPAWIWLQGQILGALRSL